MDLLINFNIKFNGHFYSIQMKKHKNLSLIFFKKIYLLERVNNTFHFISFLLIIFEINNNFLEKYFHFPLLVIKIFLIQ